MMIYQRNLTFVLVLFFLGVATLVQAQTLPERSPELVKDSVNSGEFSIYYELMGEGEPLYIFTGEPGLTPRYMNNLRSELAKNNQTVLIYQRGTGNSVGPVNEETIQIDRFCEDIRAVKEKLAHDRIRMLGHGWGGMLAMQYMTSFPGDISKTVLVASSGYNLDFRKFFTSNTWSNLSESDQRVITALFSFAERRGSQVSDSLRFALDQLTADAQNIIVKGRLFDKSHASQIQLTVDDRNLQILTLILKSLQRMNWDLEDELRSLEDTQTLIVQGRQDPVDLETALKTRDAIPASQLKIIEECGHFPWIEQPEEFYSIVNDFMANY